MNESCSLVKICTVNLPRSLEEQLPNADYIDISPYNPSETSTVDVEIIPLLRGFIWPCGGIIAQAGCYLSRFYASGRMQRRALRSPPANGLGPLPQCLPARTGRSVR